MAESSWIAKRIAEAKKSTPDLPNPAIDRLEELLKEGFRDRSYPRTEILAQAKALLADIDSTSSTDTDGEE